MEILGNIIVTVITCSLTFIITRYEIYKKRPVDKLEISYNKFYYPVMIWGKDLAFTCTAYDNYVNQVKPRIKAYDKYITDQTKKLFFKLEESLADHKETVIAYEKFYKDIKHNNQKLRSALGYMEPNFIDKFNSKSLTVKLVSVGAGTLFIFAITLFFTIAACMELFREIRLFIRKGKKFNRVKKRDLWKYK